MFFDVIAATQAANIIGVAVPWGHAILNDFNENNIAIINEFNASVYMDVAKDNIPDEEIIFAERTYIQMSPDGAKVEKYLGIVLQEDSKVSLTTIQKISDETKVLCDAFFDSYPNFVGTPEHTYLQEKMEAIKKDHPSPLKILLK